MVKIQNVTTDGNVIGINNENHYYFPQSDSSWPTRLGVLPPRAHCYQQRDLSDAIETILSSELDKDAPTLILAGLGGVGKSQLAAEYARGHWGEKELDLLVWVSAESDHAIRAAYADTADKIGINPHGEQDTHRVSDRFLEWLANTDRRWLIVLDDVRNPGDLKGLWPPQRRTGRVAVTTRRQDAALSGEGRHRLLVGTLGKQEAVDYLHAKFADNPALLDDTAGLAHDVGYLPLALAQAAAYLADRNRSCAEYRKLLASRRKKLAELLPSSTELPDDHTSTVAATWSLSIELANQLAPTGLARPLLQLASVLASSGIPTNVFTNPAVTRYLTAAHDEGSEISLNDVRDALHCLHRLSLASIDPNDPHRNVKVHGLVQRATSDDLDQSARAMVIRTAADSLLHIWPDRSTNTVQERSLQACTAALVDNGSSYLWNANGVHKLLFRAGNSLGEIGNPAGAVNHFQHLLNKTMQAFGPDHRNTLGSRNSLAHWRGSTGDAAGAVVDLEELVPDVEHTLGPDDLLTLNLRHNLAHWRGEAGDAVGAATAFEELLLRVERVLTPDHPYALITRHTMAIWRGRAGDPAGTAAILKKLLPRVEYVFNSEHPETLNTRHNLAYWLGKAGDVTGAAAALRELLSVQESVLRPDHPDTLNTRNNMATLRGESGDAAGAATELEDLRSHVEQYLEPEHPLTLSVLHNLATWRGNAGDTTEAATALSELLPILERVFGPMHQRTLTTRHNLEYWTK